MTANGQRRHPPRPATPISSADRQRCCVVKNIVNALFIQSHDYVPQDPVMYEIMSFQTHKSTNPLCPNVNITKMEGVYCRNRIFIFMSIAPSLKTVRIWYTCRKQRLKLEQISKSGTQCHSPGQLQVCHCWCADHMPIPLCQWLPIHQKQQMLYTPYPQTMCR
jgi:hypothetical protein